MPVVGFGTSRTEDPESQVEMALSAGYRHFDCALVSSFLCGLRDLLTTLLILAKNDSLLWKFCCNIPDALMSIFLSEFL